MPIHSSGPSFLRHLFPLLISSLVLLLSLGATFGVWKNAEADLERNLKIDFDFRVREIIDRIEQRMAAYEQVLLGVKGLFMSSDHVDRNEFRIYVDTLKIDRNFPGIQGIGFSVVVPSHDKDKHIADIRNQGFPDYSIRPEGERDIYSSILYLEPFVDRNLRAFGYDMYSEPVRRKAMADSRDLSQTRISGKVILVQETDEAVQAGFLMYLPLFRDNVTYESVEERRSNIVAWIYAPFRMDDFMAGVGGERASDLNLEIFDGVTMTEEARMHSSSSEALSSLYYLNTIRTIDIDGHAWTLAVSPGASFKQRISLDKPRYIAAAGATLSVLLATIIWQLASGRARALALATEMTRELRESEARFRQMADSAPVLIWISGADSRCFWFNKVWLDFTGRTLDQEKDNGWLEGVHPDDRQRCIDCYLDHFNRREPFRMEYRLRRFDGDYRWIDDHGVPRVDDHGNFSGYIGSCTDITERRQVETILRTHSEALTRSNADLEQFAYSVSHDMRQPLRTIAGHLHLLELGLAEQLDEDNKENLAFALDGAKRMDAMIVSLLDYSRVGRKTEPKICMETRESLNEALKFLEVEIEEKRADVVVQGDWPVLSASRDELTRLLQNLIANAIKYHDSEEVPHVTVVSTEHAGIWRVRIADNGIGIDPKQIDKLFQFFSRLQSRARFDGNGMGLALCRRIVEHHGGRIWAESEGEGKGSTFVFEIPLAQNNASD
ncbi:CHASE domain-containing protein [Methylotuvimicrobium buryatense]|uniref:histidine kinase n=1 Tax=Methylotuvimicrobium buryatense TaxID=95641 RepID=A0A4P9UL11_METBY|nr:CHASE domain-containing protein [Methylotuvimicrobium buryatense]QCW81939.1 PAS domain S-box protein [Methylotuvimicrobium buryatense]